MSTAETSSTSSFDAVRYTLAEQGSPWIFIVSSRAAVAIKAPSEPEVVEGLWAMMRGGESRADVLAAQVPEFSGERRTAFSVVGDGDAAAPASPMRSGDSAAARTPASGHTVIAHGRAAVDALLDTDDATGVSSVAGVDTATGSRSEPASGDEDLISAAWVRIEAAGDAPWSREDLAGSRIFALGDVAVEVGGEGSGVSFPLDAGVVVANRLDVRLDGADRVRVVDAPVEETILTRKAGASASAPALDDDDAAHGRAAAASADESGDSVAPDVATVSAGHVESAGPAESAGQAESAGPRTLDVSDPAGGIDGAPLTKAPGAPVSVEAETETVIRPRRSVVPRLADDSLLQHDGETVLRPDIAPPVEEETVFRQAPFVPDDPQTVMYGFRVNGGQAYPLDAVHYFGRNPRQPRIPLPDPSRLVPVVSSTKSVSATHLELKQVGDSIVATDLTSTNGTSVNLPHKHWQRLRQGESIVVVPGSLIDIGDGNVIEILPPWQSA